MLSTSWKSRSSNMQLPLIEQETRDSIGKYRTKQLVFQNSQKIELPLLLTQAEALTYGSHLAKVVANHEPEPTRKQYLDQLSIDLMRLQERVVALLKTGP